MQSLRRFLAWSLFLGFLWAVGWAVFVYVRHTPRRVIEGPLVTQHLSPDGSRLATLKGTDSGWRGPLQIWDVRSGQIIHELLGNTVVSQLVFSPDGRHAAAWLGHHGKRDELALVDYLSGEEWRFDGLPTGPIHYSPNGSWLYTTPPQIGMHCFVDVSRHQRVPRPEGRFFCFNKEERPVFFAFDAPYELFVWDFHAMKKVGAVAPNLDHVVHSPDGAILVSMRHKGADKGPGVDVWDLTTLTQIWQLPHDAYVDFSSDSHTMALRSDLSDKESIVRFYDLFQRQALGTAKIKMNTTEMIGTSYFSPDGSLWFYAGVSNQSIIDVVSGQELWEGTIAKRWQFAGATGIVLCQEDDNQPLKFLEARTGKTRATARGSFELWKSSYAFTSDGEHSAIWAHSSRSRAPYFWELWLEKRYPELFGNNLDNLVVMETATGRELLRLINRGNRGWLLSDDASTLITVDRLADPSDGFAIRIWDVSPTRAYLLAVGAAVGMAIALLGLRRAWFKLKANAAWTKQTPAPSA